MRNVFGSFTDIDAVEASDPVDVSNLEDAYVAVTGTFVATLDVEFTMDDLAGTPSWHVHPTLTGKTVPFNGTIGFPVRAIRLNATAHTSGTAEGSYSGKDPDQD